MINTSNLYRNNIDRQEFTTTCLFIGNTGECLGWLYGMTVSHFKYGDTKRSVRSFLNFNTAESSQSIRKKTIELTTNKELKTKFKNGYHG